MKLIIEMTQEEAIRWKSGEEWEADEFENYVKECINDDSWDYIGGAEFKIV